MFFCFLWKVNVEFFDLLKSTKIGTANFFTETELGLKRYLWKQVSGQRKEIMAFTMF